MSVMNTSELGELVRKWVHFDGLAATFSKQAASARKAKGTAEGAILSWLRANKMTNSIIQIGGGRLSVAEEKHVQPLTLQRLEGLLHDYYREQRPHSPDETADIMTYLRENRKSTVEQVLKKF
jgi:hypothetical protein